MKLSNKQAFRLFQIAREHLRQTNNVELYIFLDDILNQQSDELIELDSNPIVNDEYMSAQMDIFLNGFRKDSEKK